MSRKPRIVWLCDQEHLDHPFIVLGARTLAKAGRALAVIDRSAPRAGLPYRHLGTGLTRELWKFRGRPIRGSGQAKKWLAWGRMAFRLFRERPDVVIVDLPSAGRIALLFLRFFRARLVYYPFELFGEQSVPVTEYWLRCERRLLARADAVITQNEYRAAVYRRERGARAEPAIVHNYKEARTVAPAGKLRDFLGIPEGDKVVLYEGHLIPGRWLDRLLAAAALFPGGTHLALIGKKTPWWEATYAAALAADAGLRERVRVGGWIPHDELLGYVADADAGVIIYDDSVRNNLYCEPGKLSDYVLAGVPVVAPAFPTLAPLLERYGVGRVFAPPDPAAIAATVAEVVSVPKADWKPKMDRAREALVWETQAPAFLAAVSGRPAHRENV